MFLFFKKLFFVPNRLRHSPFDLEKKEAGHRSKPTHGRDSHGSGFMQQYIQSTQTYSSVNGLQADLVVVQNGSSSGEKRIIVRSRPIAFQRLSVFCHQGLSLCCLCCSKVIARIELNALKLRVKWNQNVKNKLKFQIKMKRKMRRKRQNAESKEEQPIKEKLISMENVPKHLKLIVMHFLLFQKQSTGNSFDNL